MSASSFSATAAAAFALLFAFVVDLDALDDDSALERRDAGALEEPAAWTTFFFRFSSRGGGDEGAARPALLDDTSICIS